MECGDEVEYSAGIVGQVTPNMHGGGRVDNCMLRANDQGLSSERREQHLIPCIGSLSLNGERRSSKTRRCRDDAEEGCPSGDKCTFLHDDELKPPESFTMSLSPNMGSGYTSRGTGSDQKPLNWKTKICQKWERLGFCSYGRNCCFAHGMDDIHKNGVRIAEIDARGTTSVSPDRKQGGGSLKRPLDNVFPTLQSFYGPNEKPGPYNVKDGRGPMKISKKYGDWFDDL